MTAHFLVDLFGNPMFPLTNSPIIDVRESNNQQSLVNGCFLVRVPDFIQITRPTNLGNLLTQKYQGLLSFYAGFGNVAYDDFIDPAHVNMAYPNTKARVGQRNTIAVAPSGYLQSSLYTLPWSGAPPGPVVAVVVWEAFDYVDSDPKTGRFMRNYRERPASGFTVQVSFDNGSNWNTVTSEGVFNISPAQQGVDFIIRFQNMTANDLYLGSWAVVY